MKFRSIWAIYVSIVNGGGEGGTMSSWILKILEILEEVRAHSDGIIIIWVLLINVWYGNRTSSSN